MRKTYIIVLLGLLNLISTSTFAQNLSFYNFRPQRDSVQKKPVISSYNIGSAEDLYILLSPLNALKEELAKLAPQIKKEELLEKGNYSFKFLIDGKTAYTENLHPGALLPVDKITNRPIDIVFISNSRSGLWSINTWERFMLKAGITTLNANLKELSIEISAYINNGEVIYSPVLAKAKINITRIMPPIDPKQMLPQKIADESGFTLSKESFNQQLITELNTKIADKTFRLINGIVVLKKGKLLLEQYYNGENRATLHDPRSVSKSITATLMGMAIKDGFIKSENQRIGEFYPLKAFQNYSLKKDSVRLIDLLTMSSAFNGNDDIDASPGNEENMYPTADYTKFTLDLPMDSARNNGKSWSYFTAGTMLLADILDKNIPGGLETYTQKNFFEPLGIKKWEWARTPQERPFGGGGLRLRALDFAKYGQLYSNGGVFNGKRLLPESWVKKSLYPHQVLPADRPGFYGFLFWNKTFNIKGKTYEAYYSSGNGGNKIYIFRNIPLVIVITASAYGSGFAHPQVDLIMEQYLLPAVL